MSTIEVFFEEIQPINIHEKHLKNRVNNLITNEIKVKGDINVILCSDDYLLNINKQYLNHDYYTDIVTFDYVEKNTISGDLFISVDRVRENAEEHRSAFLKELYRVVFHGILHLIGYKDKTTGEKKEMREKEEEYLEDLDFSSLEK